MIFAKFRPCWQWFHIKLVVIALLGLDQSFAQGYNIAHCYQGCPLGAGAENHLIIRPIYTLSYNPDMKSADWAAYRVSAGAIGIASSLSRRPQADQYVENTLRETDFQAGEASGLILAQYVPLVDFAGTPFWQDVNYLTNAVARSASLSQGAWYGLDWAIRNLVNRVGDVYVVTGPVYYPAARMPRLGTSTPHRIPDAFFKIVVAGEGRGAAFLLEQEAPVHVHHCDMRSSIDEIEGLTGLSFFPDRPQPFSESAYEQLGCY